MGELLLSPVQLKLASLRSNCSPYRLGSEIGQADHAGSPDDLLPTDKAHKHRVPRRFAVLISHHAIRISMGFQSSNGLYKWLQLRNSVHVNHNPKISERSS